MHHMDAYEAAGEEAGRKLHKNVESSIKQFLATTPHETPTIRTLVPHHKNYTSSTNQTRRTLLEKQGRAHKRCTPVDPHSWMCKSGTTSTNLHTSSYVRTRVVILKTCRRRWMIGRNGERRSGISAQAARHDDDDVCIWVGLFIELDSLMFLSNTNNWGSSPNTEFRMRIFKEDKTLLLKTLSFVIFGVSNKEMKKETNIQKGNIMYTTYLFIISLQPFFFSEPFKQLLSFLSLIYKSV